MRMVNNNQIINGDHSKIVAKNIGNKKSFTVRIGKIDKTIENSSFWAGVAASLIAECIVFGITKFVYYFFN